MGPELIFVLWAGSEKLIVLVKAKPGEASTPVALRCLSHLYTKSRGRPPAHIALAQTEMKSILQGALVAHVVIKMDWGTQRSPAPRVHDGVLTIVVESSALEAKLPGLKNGFDEMKRMLRRKQG